MARIFFILGLIVAAAVAAAAQSGRTKPTPTPTPDEVRIVTDEVKLNVLAFDEDGDFVSGVTAEDLVITENNIIHQPTSVRRIPANVLIVMDTGGELRSVKSLEQTKKTARALVETLREGDSVAVLQYADTARIIGEWTDNKAEAIAAINRARFGSKAAFVDAVNLATDFLQKSGVDNKHMVLISDGTDTWERTNARREAFQRILGTDITVYVISYTKLEAVDIEPHTKAVTNNSPPPQAMPPEVVAQLPNGVRQTAQNPKVGPTIITDRKHLKRMRDRLADLERAEDQLMKLAEDSNGEMMIPDSLPEMIERAGLVARLIDKAYVVTYLTKVPFDENRTDRIILVTSKRPGLAVQARRRLVIPNDRR